MRRRATGPARAAILALGALLALGAAWPATRVVAHGDGLEALRAEAAALFAELAALRGVPAPGPPPPVALRHREERRRFIAGEISRKLSPARVEADRRALVAWGLIPPDLDLARFLTDLMTEQAAAYYDPVGKTMSLASWLDAPARREALLHELVHALQDRQLDLDRFLAAVPGRSDGLLARQALVEGEALALTIDRALRQKGQALGGLPDVRDLERAIAASAAGPFLTRAPRFLREQLTFPYAHGLGFVHAFLRRHPWSALGDAYRDPPRATAQILHPERFWERREDPVPVALPDLAPALGPGARALVEDDIGEFALSAVLREFLGEGATLGHWRGDRFALWEAGSDLVLVALTVWDGDADAERFAGDYVRLLRKKHALPGGTGEAGAAVWHAAGRAFLVERRGPAVLLLERVPPTTLDAVRRAAWAARPTAPAP